MKDDSIKLKAIKLKELVKEVNELMDQLDQLNVDVRIRYIERKFDVPQSINIWKIEERNDYLTDE